LIVANKTKALFTITTLNLVGWAATMPFLAVYLAVSRSTPFWFIGTIYLATGATTLASQIIGGRLIDLLGPKRIMLAGSASSIVFALLLSYLIQTDAAVGFLASLYPLSAFARGLSQPAPSAIIASYDRDEMTRGFSFLNIGSNLGFAIGPALGGVLASMYSYSSVFFFSAGVFALVMASTLAWIDTGALPGVASIDEETQPIRRWLSWKDDRTMILFLVLVFCSFVASGYEITPLSLYAASFLHLSDDLIGYLFATNGIVIVILQIPLMRFLSRWKTMVLPLIVGNLVMVAGFLTTVISTGFLDLEIVMIVLTVGEMLITVPSQTIATIYSSAGNRGTRQGYYNAVVNTGRTISSFVGPLTFSLLFFEPALSWYAISALTIVTAVGFVSLSTNIQRDGRMVQSNQLDSGRSP
jgi:MFS family permease